ncbi:hypothetical protein DM01DRAFT_1288982 [Hesseltinella vesiculosa]|uniref:Methyltransferase domain-containing protein n=1 Tax=Hesseltinella vesiculosa TaxID=101127 RepID=A0A1X2GEX1_9FUNG|nr:hypothetical protein DM01DRAFT_1288982 [Hesseltinella vesiculosa]
MGPMVASVALEQGIDHVVDLGAGQGYLSRVLAFQHDLLVMAVDGSEVQTCGAKRFDSIASKGFKAKSHKLHHVTDLLTHDNAAAILASVQQQGDAATPVDADLVVSSKGTVDSHPAWLICGLHACGDLSSLTLRLFTQQPEIRALVNVGCCYHFLTHSHDTTGHHAETGATVGFPMSRPLQSYQLGSTACMLACQAPSRWLDQKDATIKAYRHHFYRCLLHWIMIDKGLWLLETKAPVLGRLNAKRDFSSFPVYVKAALGRLGLAPDAISEAEAEAYYSKYKQQYHTDQRIALLWTIRALLGPVIESLVLVDRYQYLQETLPETPTKQVWLAPLFDPVVSPRNMVVMATK